MQRARVPDRLPGSVRSTATARARDAHRLRLILERIRLGEDADAATWAVVSDPRHGTPRWIARRERGQGPPELRRLALIRGGMMRRSAPELLEAAGADALARLAAAAPAVADRIVEVATSKEGGGSSAHQIAAAKLVLQAARVIETGGSSSSTTNVQVNVAREHADVVAKAHDILNRADSDRVGNETPRGRAAGGTLSDAQYTVAPDTGARTDMDGARSDATPDTDPGSMSADERYRAWLVSEAARRGDEPPEL